MDFYTGFLHNIYLFLCAILFLEIYLFFSFIVCKVWLYLQSGYNNNLNNDSRNAIGHNDIFLYYIAVNLWKIVRREFRQTIFFLSSRLKIDKKVIFFTQLFILLLVKPWLCRTGICQYIEYRHHLSNNQGFCNVALFSRVSFSLILFYFTFCTSYSSSQRKRFTLFKIAESVDLCVE